MGIRWLKGVRGMSIFFFLSSIVRRGVSRPEEAILCIEGAIGGGRGGGLRM